MSRKRLLVHGSNAVIATIVVFALVVFANYFVNEYGGRADLTREKLFSISDKTEKVLETVNSDIEIIGFFKELGLDRKQFTTSTKRNLTRSRSGLWIRTRARA